MGKTRNKRRREGLRRASRAQACRRKPQGVDALTSAPPPVFEVERRGGTYDNLVRHAARQRWGNHCPCCNARMTDRKPKKGVVASNERRTVAHNRALSLGGKADEWVYTCYRCNQEQDQMSFRDWHYVLKRLGDPRADRVGEVADLFDG